MDKITWRKACALKFTPAQFHSVQYQHMLASAASLRPTPHHVAVIVESKESSAYTYASTWYLECDGKRYAWSVRGQRFLQLRRSDDT